MTEQTTIPDPWSSAPDGAMPPFITPDERDQLIRERRVVFLMSIRQENTAHGRKWYCDIMVPPNGEERTCSFTVDTTSSPRNRLLEHLRTWMAQYNVTTLPVILVRAGQGYIFAKPPESTE